MEVLIHKHRLCHELWRLPAILLRQLDIPRQPQLHRYHRNHVQRRHVPLDAFPIRPLHQAMGSISAACRLLRRLTFLSRIHAILPQFQRDPPHPDPRSPCRSRRHTHLQSYNTLARRMVQYTQSALQPRCRIRHRAILQEHRRLDLSLYFPRPARPLRIPHSAEDLGGYPHRHGCSLHLHDPDAPVNNIK